MPVRINLKELFGSDSQDTTISKVNFNFNKLLELGVGLPGNIGKTGGPGSLGPPGLKGDTGDKGNQWYVSSGNPNTQTFGGLQDEDFYIDSTNSQIWQYDKDTDTWSIIVDLGGVVNNYLTQAGSPFIRGFGEGSPFDTRYIMFPKRGNTITDQQNDGLGSNVDNDILFLSNFNEQYQSTVLDIANFPANTDDLYNALQKIYVDVTSGIPGRYHMEFGSLYDTSGILTNLNQNLKIRHGVVDVSGGAFYPTTNSSIFKGIFSITAPETALPSTILHNGIFEFQAPKYFVGAPNINNNISIQLGSRYGLGEEANYVLFDGINIKSKDIIGDAGIGIASNYNSTNLAVNAKNLLMLDTDGNNVDGIILNTSTFQNGGNIEQLGSVGANILPITSFVNGGLAFQENTFGNVGLAMSGDTIFMVEGTSANPPGLGSLDHILFKGWLYGIGANNANSPVVLTLDPSTGLVFDNTDRHPVGAGLCDIDVNGNYIYAVNNQMTSTYFPVLAGSNRYFITYFQILKRDLNKGPGTFDTVNLSTMGLDQALNPLHYNDDLLDGAWRVKLNGNKAIVVTNHLRHFGNSDVTLPDSNFGRTGRIVSIDVTDPINPKVSQFRSEQRAHNLDLVITNNYAVTLTIQVGSPIGSTDWNGYDVQVKVHNLDSLVSGNDLTFSGTDFITLSNNPTLLNSGNSNTNSIFNKFGAIDASGNHIYAAYKNGLFVSRLSFVGNAIESVTSILYNNDADIRVMDLKVSGDSLYILGAVGGANGYAPTNSSITKVNIKNPESPYVEWTKAIGERSCSRMLVSGNNLYVSKTDGLGQGTLIPIEVDGIKTDHANIGTLKSSDADITRDLRIGNSLNVKQSLSVGQGGVNSIGPVKGTSMANNARIWYRKTGVSLNSASPTVLVLNEDHGTKYNNKWAYKISIAGGDSFTTRSVTWIATYNQLTTQWDFREVSHSNMTAVSLIPVISTGTDTFSIALNVSSGIFDYTVESIYVGTHSISSPDSLKFTMGSDYHWQRDVNALYYLDGKVGINKTNPAFDLDVKGIIRGTEQVIAGPNSISSSDAAFIHLNNAHFFTTVSQSNLSTVTLVGGDLVLPGNAASINGTCTAGNISLFLQTTSSVARKILKVNFGIPYTYPPLGAFRKPIITITESLRGDDSFEGGYNLWTELVSDIPGKWTGFWLYTKGQMMSSNSWPAISKKKFGFDYHVIESFTSQQIAPGPGPGGGGPSL